MELLITAKEKWEKTSKKGIGLLLAASVAASAVIFPVSARAENSTKDNNFSLVEDSLSITDIKEYDNNELVVVYRKEGAAISELLPSVREEELTETCSLLEVETKKELREVISVLAKDKNIGYIQPNYTYRALYTQDTFSSRQWAYYGNYNIGVEEAWNAGSGANEEVVVAIVDVGIDYSHEDLSSVMWVNPNEIPEDGIDNDENGYVDDIYGYNFFDDNSTICDYAYSVSEGEYVDDHGTHVAGIIAAVADNGVGVAGLASKSNVKLMSLKSLGDEVNGGGIQGSTDMIISAIEYAEDNGASICNMSIGYAGMDKALYQAMAESEMLFVCAAGNGEESTAGHGWNIDKKPVYPASFDLDNMIAVATMNELGYIDDSSCYGEKHVDIVAPGIDIASTVVAVPAGEHNRNSKYMLMSGTSMAAPMVTGTAAILASYFGNLTNLEIKEAILEGAAVNLNFSNKVAGNRMLNVYGAMEYWQNRFRMETQVHQVSDTSNNKRVTVKVLGNKSPVIGAAYTLGEEKADYFWKGAGTALPLKDNQASFKITESGIYTIYLLCEDGREITEQVTVEVPVVEKVKLSAKKKTLKKGKTYKLKAKFTPSDMYVKLVYKTSNPKVATVSSAGKITAKKKGNARITVYAKDGNTMKKAVCTVTVTN